MARKLTVDSCQLAAVVLTGVFLAGCIPPDMMRGGDDRSLEGGPEAEARIYADLIERLLDNGQYYAALAHVEEHRVQTGEREPRLDLYEARALYGLEQDGQAMAAYQGMLDGPLAAQAHHGLGLIYARRGQLEQAMPHFIAAVRGRPTDVSMRNDLGFALMQQGRYRDANLQLSTALELAPDNSRALHNLMMLLFASGEEARARALAESAELSPEQVERLRRDAQQLNVSGRPAQGGTR